MESTPIFDFPYPEETDKPDGAAQIQALAKKLEEKLEKIEGLIDGEPAAGNLIVVNGTADPSYKAVTGDVTFSSAGVATIGNNKVVAAKIAANAVTNTKLANGAVESRSCAPTAGKVGATTHLEATPAWQDIPGMDLSISVLPASYLHIFGMIFFELKNGGPEQPIHLSARISVDGEPRPEEPFYEAEYSQGKVLRENGVMPLNDLVPLAGGEEHSIQFQAYSAGSTGVVSAFSHFQYILTAV